MPGTVLGDNSECELTGLLPSWSKQCTKGARHSVNNHTNKCKVSTLIHTECQNWYLCPGQAVLRKGHLSSGI